MSELDWEKLEEIYQKLTKCSGDPGAKHIKKEACQFLEDLR